MNRPESIVLLFFFSSLLVRSPRIEISITKTWRNRHLKLNDVKKTSNLVCFSASFRVFSFWHFTCYSLCSLFVLAANELNCLIVFITMYRNSFGIACNYSNARSDFAQNNTKKNTHSRFLCSQNIWSKHMRSTYISHRSIRRVALIILVKLSNEIKNSGSCDLAKRVTKVSSMLALFSLWWWVNSQQTLFSMALLEFVDPICCGLNYVQ